MGLRILRRLVIANRSIFVVDGGIVIANHFPGSIHKFGLITLFTITLPKPYIDEFAVFPNAPQSA